MTHPFDHIEKHLPRHAGGMSIEFDPHKAMYESARDYLVHREFDDDSVISACEAADRVVLIQWYPDTPIGFFMVAAPTLAEAWARMMETEAYDA